MYYHISWVKKWFLWSSTSFIIVIVYLSVFLEQIFSNSQWQICYVITPSGFYPPPWTQQFFRYAYIPICNWKRFYGFLIAILGCWSSFPCHISSCTEAPCHPKQSWRWNFFNSWRTHFRISPKSWSRRNWSCTEYWRWYCSCVWSQKHSSWWDGGILIRP